MQTIKSPKKLARVASFFVFGGFIQDSDRLRLYDKTA